MIEREIKAMLTEGEYITLARFKCQHKAVNLQTNYYFDTDDLSMNKKGVTCRIRHKNGLYKATVKKHNADGAECSIETDICEKAEFDPTVFNTLGLRFQGELVTERLKLCDDVFCKIVLDKNTYLGKTDFELEIEYSEAYKKKAFVCLDDIADFLCRCGRLQDKKELISRISQAKSKSQRFFEEKEKN